MELLIFILISFGFIAIPGPNVLVVISTSISHGTNRGLQTVAGVSLAMAIQLCIAAMGTAWFVATLTRGFLWLKWAGVIYLVYLGINHIIYSVASDKYETQVSALGSFQRGFWVSLTNPKTILFFSAFLPQFASQQLSYFVQVAVLSLIFWLIAVLVNLSYVLLSSKLGAFLKSKEFSKYQHGASGFLYLGASAALAASKHGQ